MSVFQPSTKAIFGEPSPHNGLRIRSPRVEGLTRQDCQSEISPSGYLPALKACRGGLLRRAPFWVPPFFTESFSLSHANTHTHTPTHIHTNARTHTLRIKSGTPRPGSELLSVRAHAHLRNSPLGASLDNNLRAMWSSFPPGFSAPSSPGGIFVN